MAEAKRPLDVRGMGGVMESISVVMVVSVAMMMLTSTIVQVIPSDRAGESRAEDILEDILEDVGMREDGLFIPSRLDGLVPPQHPHGGVIRVVMHDPVEEWDALRTGEPPSNGTSVASAELPMEWDGRIQAGRLVVMAW